MKKILSILLIAAMIIPFAACNTNSETNTPDGLQTTQQTAVNTDTDTSAQSPEDTLPVTYETPLNPGTYVLRHVATGKTVQSDSAGDISAEGLYKYISLDWIVLKSEQYYRIGLFKTENVNHNDKDIKYKNAEVGGDLAIKNLTSGSPVVDKSQSFTDNYVMWKITDNGDGTFSLTPRLKKSFKLTYANDQFVIEEYDESKAEDYKFAFDKVSNEDNELYKEYVSAKGNVVVRVPVDVYDPANYSVIRNDKLEHDKYVPTVETVQGYADRTQTVYDTYVELTDYIPYRIIIVHAYNYQGVMAGVVGNNNNVFVNCGPGEWFYSDLQKMQYRITELSRDDYNFMVLHEMGHMFDWNRGWTFESEMQADLKAAYFLNNTENAYAAPAEYAANECFREDIATAGFKGLSGGSMVLNMNDSSRKGYSIYRFAQIIVEYIQQYAGWESLVKTFHWYQDNINSKDIPESSLKWSRMELFLAKITEYGEHPEVDLQSSISAQEMGCLEVYFDKASEEPTATPTTEE